MIKNLVDEVSPVIDMDGGYFATPNNVDKIFFVNSVYDLPPLLAEVEKLLTTIDEPYPSKLQSDKASPIELKELINSTLQKYPVEPIEVQVGQIDQEQFSKMRDIADKAQNLLFWSGHWGPSNLSYKLQEYGLKGGMSISDLTTLIFIDICGI